jgi:hypothetical protein
VKKRDSPAFDSSSPRRESFIKWENQLENLIDVRNTLIIIRLEAKETYYRGKRDLLNLIDVRNSLIIIGCLVVIARLMALSPSKAHSRVAKR